MTHRGATGADSRDGDGAGVMTAIPHEFFKREAERDIGCVLPESESTQLATFSSKPTTPSFFKLSRQPLPRLPTTSVCESWDGEKSLLMGRFSAQQRVARNRLLFSRLLFFELIMAMVASAKVGLSMQNTLSFSSMFSASAQLISMFVISLSCVLNETYCIPDLFSLYKVRSQKVSTFVRCHQRTSYTRANLPRRKCTTITTTSTMSYIALTSLWYIRVSRRIRFPAGDRAQPMRWAAHNGMSRERACNTAF